MKFSRFIKNILDFNLLRLSLFNSISLIIKLFASIISSKALAYFIGPSGLALLGVFREFIAMTVNVSSLGFQRGIIKYSAEFKEQPKKLKPFVNTTMIAGITISVLIGFVLFLLSNTINEYLFPDHDFVIVFKILSLVIPISVISNFYISILNGLGYANTIVRINILLYVLNTISIVLLSYYFNIKGALLGVSFFYLLQLLTIFIFKPKGFLLPIFKSFNLESIYLKKLFGFTVMTIFSMMFFPFISILIRSEIIKLFGENAAGFWEAMKRISENYLFFVMSLVMLSVLPRMSKNKSDFREIVLGFYKSIIPLFMIGLSIVYVLKEYIVVLFFSHEFLETIVLFKWYEIGDVFRVMGVVLATGFFADRDIKGYIITDLFLASIMYASTIFLLRNYGLEGGAFAYFLSYFSYLILLIFYYRKNLFSKKAT